MKECKVCHKPNSEEHHIVWQSKVKCLRNCRLNKMYLCSEHHRNNDSPHKNKETDLRYKLQFQNKLFDLFNKRNYGYTKDEIKAILKISTSAVAGLCSTITKTSRRMKGYDRKDIVRACMGGTLYDADSLDPKKEFNRRYSQIERKIRDGEISAVIVKPKIVKRNKRSNVSAVNSVDFLILKKDGTYEFVKI